MDSITNEAIAAHNLTADEFKRIKELLGREPNLVELGVFSVMWSEHCSYKSSRIHLKRLPTQGARVIVPPGENAGIVDVGDGWCAAFKIESHNHPSFIEPFQGAATGVGGILRDIFTMGARPVAAMNSLRFGSLDDPKNGRRNRSLLAGVVAGIAVVVFEIRIKQVSMRRLIGAAFGSVLGILGAYLISLVLEKAMPDSDNTVPFLEVLILALMTYCGLVVGAAKACCLVLGALPGAFLVEVFLAQGGEPRDERKPPEPRPEPAWLSCKSQRCRRQIDQRRCRI